MPKIDIVIEPIGYPEHFDIIGWLVEDNTSVEFGQSIIEIGTEKISAEIPTNYSDVVRILKQKGEKLPFYSIVGKLEVTEEVFAEYLRSESQIGVTLPLTPEQNKKLHELSNEVSVQQYVIDLVINNIENKSNTD